MSISIDSLALLSAGGALLGVVIMAVLGLLLSKTIVSWAVNGFFRRFFADPYRENIFEIYTTIRSSGLLETAETLLRAESGQPLLRPMGSPRTFPAFSKLLFTPAQVARRPLPTDSTVKTRVVLGPLASKPLTLEIPIIISGMSFGMSLSEKAKIALAKGATLGGTATNSGESGLLPSERSAAKRYILQYSRGNWVSDSELVQADMIEIQIGQSAQVGSGQIALPKDLSAHVQQIVNVPPGQPATIQARPPWLEKPTDLKPLVDRLRQVTGGVPIGVKLAAGASLEQDLAWIIDAGVDCIAIDGTGGATHASSTILEDDFGLPLVYALPRTVRFLREKGCRERITLIACGGLRTPGDFLKAIALGADAVYIATAALFAIAGPQIAKVLPFEPPTELLFATGTQRKRLDVEQAAKHLDNFLKSSVAEMAEAARAMGVDDFWKLSPQDLIALNDTTARITGVASAIPSLDRGSPQVIQKEVL